MRIWLSGGAGFVGRRLGDRLANAGHHVVSVDREVEICESAAVTQSIAKAEPDALIHLAAQSSAALARHEPELTARVNFLGARNVLEALGHVAPQARLLLISSSELYGVAEPGAPAFREQDPIAPGSAYGRSKAAADLLAGLYADRGLDVLRVRPFNHTGVGQIERFVAPSFARQVAEIASGRSEPVLRVGNLESVRDFLDVEDVIDAYLALLDVRVPADIYNVASGVGRRIRELLDTLLDLAGVECRIEVDPERLRPSDHSVGDATRLRNATGWAPHRDFKETLAGLLNAARAA